MSRRTAWIVCGALMAIAAAFRIYLMSMVFANVDGDQAVLGIMAYHIQRGEHPVFYYGQPYTGSLEAYAAALLFSVFGANDFTVRLPALAFSVAFVGAVYWLGAVLYGLRIAVLAGLFLALGPALLIVWSTAAGAGYSAVMVCGALLLLLALRYPDLRAMPLTVALAGGLLVGLGVWMEPLIAEYLLPLGVVYALPLFVGWAGGGARNRETSLQGPRHGPCIGWTRLAGALVAITAGSAIGSAPFLVYNLRHHWVTLTYLSHYTLGSNPLAVAVRLITQSLPVLLGLAIPATENESPAVFTHQTARHALPYVAGLVAGAYILGRLVLKRGGLPVRIAALGRVPGACYSGAARDGVGTAAPLPEPLRWSRPPMDRDGVLALFGISCLLFFGISTRTPRYLLPLYTLTPLVLDCLIPRRPRRLSTWIAVLATGALVTASVTITVTTAPRRPIAGLTRLLETRHVRVAYANDYWIVYRISFETHERVLAVGVGDNSRLGLVRIPSYLDVAARTPANRLAWIFYAGRAAGERNFHLLLRRERIRASRVVWADRTIYDRFSQPVRAAGPYATKGF